MYSYRADFDDLFIFFIWEHDWCTVIGLILDKQIIYGSTMTVQLIVLILNKQIIYESAMEVQLIVLILNKQIIDGSMIDVQL